MASNLLFYYFGDDEAYFKALQGEFKKHTRLAIDFKRLYQSDEKKIQSLFINAFSQRPAVIFIDFSKQTADYMQLARILARTPLEHKLTLVALVDYLSPQDVLMESLATGVNLVYIKSAEIYDVVFDVVKLIAPQEIAAHGFAIASLKGDEWNAGITAKIGYVQGEGLHVETDHKMSKGERLKLNHAWIKGRVVPSQEVFVTAVAQTNMFYHFKYNANLDFIFIDEFLPPEGMEEDRIKEKKAEREELVHYHKKQLKKWIDENLSRSQEKKAKVLIIDREFHFYQNQQRSDKHPYTIRCVPFLTNVAEELSRLQPQVIAFSLEEGGGNEKKNDNEALFSLTQSIASNYGEDYRPFIIVFNSKTPSRELQTNLSYPNAMSTESELTVEVLIKMAEIFDKKLKKTDTSGGIEIPKVFIKKTNPSSLAEILIPITIVKLSETDVIFQTEVVLEPGMNLHVTIPVDMFIHVQPSKATGKIPEYYGLIHCLGEDDKKELRRYVNSVFFREHDAKLLGEVNEFKKLNDAKLQQKVEKEKVAQEAAAAATAEAKKPEEPDS